MMKRMSRLVSALLVLAMLCALVPAALADDLDSLTPDSNGVISVFVKDKFELDMPDGCTAKGHSRTLTFVSSAGKSVSGYLTYSTTTGKYTAEKTTLSTNTTNTTLPGDYVVVQIGCNDRACENYKNKVTKDYKFMIFSQATGITTSEKSVTVVKGSTATIDVSVAPVTGLQDIRCEGDPSGIASASFDPATKKLTISGLKTSPKGYVTLFADYGTDHPKSVELPVNVVDHAVVTIKKDKNIVASTDDNPIKGETVTVGSASFTLTADVAAATGTTAKINWISSEPNYVTVSSSGVVDVIQAGKTAKITARAVDKMGNTIAEAHYNISVIGDVKSLSLRGGEDVDFSSEEIALNSTLDLTAVTDPTDVAPLVKWTVSDESVLDIATKNSANYDSATKTVTARKITLLGKDTGKAVVTAKIGNKQASMEIFVRDTKIITGAVKRDDYSIRDNSDRDTLISQFQKAYPTVWAYVKDANTIEVPVTWTDFDYIEGKTKVRFYGRINQSDSDAYIKYKFEPDTSREVVAEAKLTNEAMATNVSASASKTSAEPGDKVTLTVKATADPAGATLSYQWYMDGAPISGATSASYTYTVPSSGASTYKFFCQVTATKDGKKGPATNSNEIELKVLRDYEVEVSVDKTSCTVGQSPKATVTVYDCRGTTKKTVSNPNVSWKLIDTAKGTELDSKIATISGGTITTKATDNASGQKITVQVTFKDSNNDTYTGTKEITLSAATAGAIKMSVGDGATIKSTTINTKAAAAVNNSSITLSYVKFGTPTNCTLTKSASSSTAIGSTACYFSTTTGQKLSDVYVKLASGSASGSVTYTVYNNSDNAVVTGTINFDNASSGNITCLGIDFADAEAAEMIAEEFPEAEYVKFDTLDVKYGRLLLGYKSIVEIDSAKDVKDSDKFYLKNSSSVDGVEDLYLLPRTDYYGAISLSYTAYSSSNKSLGESKLTFNVVRKTASSKFTDVTSANVGSWAADAIDFMADNGLVGGTGNNKFSPTGTMTRCDLVLIMYRMAGQPSVTGVENPFTDVNANDYFYKAVLWAYKNGVVNGTGANTFSPKKNITREQIASILYRYSGATTASGSLTSFTDAGSVSDYATTAMKWAVGAGIIGGSNGKLDPQGNATRAQVAVMLHRFLNK